LVQIPPTNVDFGVLTALVFLGVVGVATVFTTTGALVAQASGKSGLLAALSFPTLALVLLSGVHGVKAALGLAGKGMTAWQGAQSDLTLLACFAVIALTASLLLFDFLWEE
jgi:hypothetical protein